MVGLLALALGSAWHRVSRASAPRLLSPVLARAWRGRSRTHTHAPAHTACVRSSLGASPHPRSRSPPPRQAAPNVRQMLSAPRCHEQNLYGKFIGSCNDAKAALDACFRAEKEARRRANFDKSAQRGQPAPSRLVGVRVQRRVCRPLSCPRPDEHETAAQRCPSLIAESALRQFFVAVSAWCPTAVSACCDDSSPRPARARRGRVAAGAALVATFAGGGPTWKRHSVDGPCAASSPSTRRGSTRPRRPSARRDHAQRLRREPPRARARGLVRARLHASRSPRTTGPSTRPRRPRGAAGACVRSRRCTRAPTAAARSLLLAFALVEYERVLAVDADVAARAARRGPRARRAREASPRAPSRACGATRACSRK